ncbi:hypothetical protein GCM10011490_03160 [Pseudoclavibacter endophyticus]|uniref:SURF1-like protein n=1 Tax=Pseudoclavibacter endophyticus TaxID=1778590 RepID=A0A6H9WMQ8_9MICO|nr:SURF1 family protein [Pseudoclavibacter endophyticus]KAB1650156.1 SURF1 family protein [Pseudoclavibacter endophyticus]GGA56683.1 hypothetical protein GCM10011490_03160 [Pseudoclavibacter endophyticus]
MSGAGKWRFALTRRWFGYLGFVIVFAIACGFLSHWQFDRRDERVAANQHIEQNYDAAPVSLDTALPRLDAWDDGETWQPVVLHGRYLPDEQVLARARPMDGMPGFEILVPFETTDGTIFIVNRGWLQTGNEQDLPDEIPQAPSAEMTVVARLQPGEPQVPGRTAPEGQIATIHLPTFADRLGEDRVYTGAYGLLAAEEPPAPAGKLPTKPALDEGNHLSYAFQWIIFAVIAAIGLVWGVRNEYRHRNPDDPEVRAARERALERARRRGPTDADEEDALLDEVERVR